MARDDSGSVGPPDGRTVSIGALSRATRIPVETLRTWERRYGSPRPLRKASGHRVYPASAIERLRRVARLLEEGHRPGEILGLTPRELDALLSLSLGEDRAPTPADAPGASPAHTLRAMLRATVQLEREALLSELRTAWVRFGPVRFLDEIAGAWMVEVGRAWHAGRLEVGHEHFASACLSDFLRAAREPYDRRARGPRVVATLLPGDAHEGGLLIVSALLAFRGCRVLYLGAGMPTGKIASAARAGRAAIVTISVSAAMPRARSRRAISGLRRALPARVPLWLGGAGAPDGIRGVERFESLAALDARLTDEAGSGS